MTPSKTVQAGRAEDFHMFSRVLFTAACFLFLGMLLPESVPASKQPEMLIIIGMFTTASVWFHHVGKKARQRSEETGTNM